MSGGKGVPRTDTDILASYLAATGEFIVLEREESSFAGSGAGPGSAAPGNAGVNALIYGSIDAFDAETEALDAPSAAGPAARKRVSHARVTVRIVDPSLGSVLFSKSGAAETHRGILKASGSDSVPAAIPAEAALNAAIAGLVGNINVSLGAQPWRAVILGAVPGQVTVSAGRRSGLRIGQELRVVRPGRKVVEPSSGLVLELPGDEVGRIQVISQFGGETDEGSVCRVLSGGGFARTDRVELEGEP